MFNSVPFGSELLNYQGNNRCLKTPIIFAFRLNLELRDNEGRVPLWLALSCRGKIDPLDEENLPAKLVRSGASPDAVNTVTGILIIRKYNHKESLISIYSAHSIFFLLYTLTTLHFDVIKDIAAQRPKLVSRVGFFWEYFSFNCSIRCWYLFKIKEKNYN